MKDFFRHNGILILIAAILLALVTAVVSMLFGGVADPLSNLVGIVTTPVRNGITAVTNWAEEKYNDAFELEQMKEELAGLKQRNAELEAQAREAEAALQENERLRNLLELPLWLDGRKTATTPAFPTCSRRQPHCHTGGRHR